VTTTHQSQEADLLPTNQLHLGGDLETSSGSLGLLLRDTIVVAFGFLLFIGLNNKVIFFGARGRWRGGLASVLRQ
jgi:hypothetical protein